MSRRNVLLMVVSLCCLAFVCGCGSSDRLVKTGFLSDYSNLQEHSSSSLRYVNKPALAGKYRSIIVDRVEVHFQAGAKAIKPKSEGKLTEKDMADLTNYFHSALVKAVSDAGWKVVHQPGPNVCRLRVAITDLEETNVLLAAVPQARLVAKAGTGGAGVEAELIDSHTGVQLGAAVEMRGGSRVPFTGLSEWGGAKAAMDVWTGRLKQHLVEAKVW